MNRKLSMYHVVTPSFFDELDQESKRVVFATRTAEIRIINEITWGILESGAFDRLPTELLSDFAAMELLVPSDQDELATVLTRNNADACSDHTLPLVIQPTAFCQLGCSYCGQKHTPKWLSPNHQDAFIERSRAKLASKQFRHFRIGWFGAEPLSGLNVMRSLSPRLKALAESFDCTYGSSITTNGLALTEKVATELVKEHAVNSITVSLDGIAEFHDARRYRKNGQATFRQIFANVVALARRTDLDIEINIRTNVDRYNYEGVSPLLRMLAEERVQQRVKYYVAPIHSWGNDAHARSLSPEEFAALEVEWFCDMSQLGFLVGLTPKVQSVVCIAVHPDAEVIDATGTIFNCTEVSYVPAYGTPNKYAISHVSSEQINGQRNLLGSFNARIGRGQYPCSMCRMLPVCGGACPKAWLEGHPPCPSAKYNIEQRLLLSYAISRGAEKSLHQRAQTLERPCR